MKTNLIIILNINGAMKSFQNIFIIINGKKNPKALEQCGDTYCKAH